jgi:hypothetical protein
VAAVSRPGVPGADLTVRLTLPQARLLWYAAAYMADLDPDGDGLSARDEATLRRGQARLGAQIETAEKRL